MKGKIKISIKYIFLLGQVSVIQISSSNKSEKKLKYSFCYARYSDLKQTLMRAIQIETFFSIQGEIT